MQYRAEMLNEALERAQSAQSRSNESKNYEKREKRRRHPRGIGYTHIAVSPLSCIDALARLYTSIRL